MANHSIVGTGKLASGEVVCVSTTRRVNALRKFDGQAWSLVEEWKGKEVTAAAVCGNRVVCPALDGAIYVYDPGGIRKLSLGDPKAWIYAACELDERRVLMGGSLGFLYELDTESGEVTKKSLGPLGISRPGRTIHALRRDEDRVYIAGAKNLLVEYQGDEATDLANPAAFAGKEIFFNDVACQGERLWLASFGGQPRLFSLEGETLTEHENPAGSGGNGGLGLRLLEGELLVYQQTAVIGEPGNWRSLAPGLVTDGISDVEDSPVAGERCVIVWKGPSHIISGGEFRTVPIFEG